MHLGTLSVIHFAVWTEKDYSCLANYLQILCTRKRCTRIQCVRMRWASSSRTPFLARRLRPFFEWQILVHNESVNVNKRIYMYDYWREY